ncbi:MAG TPA: tetraacyldisaccharide 4'-kinase [Candidatus Omnitrophota bacterium]|nr:tetraacyldisaccharide 4'-kinase [Candidatus Omnitrophota bacterium]
MKEYFFLVMTDRKTGPGDRVAAGVLYFVSILYAMVMRFRGRMYKRGFFKVRKAAVPVISVGNITLGGTGKTPFVAFLADRLTALGMKPAVLTRGYGDDEHRMLRDDIPDVPVVVGSNRVRNAEKAVRLGANILIMDDGFQHRRLGRDLDIVLLDSAKPFGNGYVFPRGTLREPQDAIRRADVVVLSKCDKIPEGTDLKKIAGNLDIRQGVPVIAIKYKAKFLSDVTGAVYPAENFKGKKVCIVSGIADPEYFGSMVGKTGAIIESERYFMDHHAYTQNDVNEILRMCVRNEADAVIVTAKDYVKLRKLDLSELESKLFVLKISVDITQGEEVFSAGLNSLIHASRS